MMDFFTTFVTPALQVLAAVFVFVVGLLALAVLVMFFIDSNQSRDAVRHNYPVVGRFRELFTRLGEFFRQYFFALDREEMPFNRAERDWIYRSSQGKDNTVPFGSTRSLQPVGTPIFVNCAFPALGDTKPDPHALVFGAGTPNPYSSTAIINISAMSYGSISKPAVQALSRGAAEAGVWLNTGEGGLSSYHLEGGCDIVFQIGTAKYGVRDKDGNLSDEKLREVAAHDQVKMFEIKLSQGAKPGKGGILPAKKVNKEIAKVRGIKQGEDSISPNRFPEVDSVADLLAFVERVRSVTGKPTGIKTAIGAYGWIEDLCAAIIANGVETAPDFITIDGGEGGTGAAPMPLIDNVGLSVREALPIVIDILERHGLRERVKVIASGKLATPAEVAWAYCAGADVVNTARGFMFSIGCIQAMRCNTNECPTGITTHKKSLQAGLDPKVKYKGVANFVERMTRGVGIIAHSCGVQHPRDLERFHVRLVQAHGRSIPMNELYPQSDRSLSSTN
jgi:glutamate synthase domain-containing protein 2